MEHKLFLHPFLAKQTFDTLLSISAKIIKTCHSLTDWGLVNFETIHSLANVATPRIMAKMTQAMLLYDVMVMGKFEEESTLIAVNEAFEVRTSRWRYFSSNTRLVGRQLIENGLGTITDFIPPNYKTMTQNMFRQTMQRKFEKS